MKKIGLLLFTSTLLSLSSWGQTVIYVNENATGNWDGTSWTDAYSDLSSAINSSSNGDEIWVAAGTYKPASGTTFNAVNEIKMYGGFPTSGNPTFADRDSEVNVTILSGDINGDDASNNYADNTARVISFGSTFLIDGFTISNGGNGANGGTFGAGLHSASSTGTVQYCNFQDNSVFDSSTGFIAGAGGAIWVQGANAIEIQDTFFIDNCLFRNNFALNGGAICTETGIEITNSRFDQNIANVGPAISVIAPWDDQRDEVFATIKQNVFRKNFIFNAQPGINFTTTRNSFDGSTINSTIEFCTFKDEQSVLGYISNNPTTNFSELYITVRNNLVDLVSEVNDIFPFDPSQTSDGLQLSSGGNNVTNSNTQISMFYATNGVLDYSVEDTVALDFILDCSSFGINTGDSLTTITTDINGEPRINGDRPESGAFESDCFGSSNGLLENSFNQLVVYPNPVNDVLTIENGIGRVIILNLSGQVVIDHEIEYGEVNVSKLETGVYIVQLETDQGIAATRFMKS